MDNLIELIEKLQSEIDKLNQEETRVVSIYISNSVWDSHYATVHLIDSIDNLKFMDALPEAFKFETYYESIRYIKVSKGIQYMVSKRFYKGEMEEKELEVYAKEIMFREE